MKKAIFVSGGSRGIGWAIARKFYLEGFMVGICGRDSQTLEERKKKYPDLIIFEADLSQRTQIQLLAEQIKAQMGPLDVLVNNVGFYQAGKILEEEDGILDYMLDLNLKAGYYLTRELSPQMINRKKGDIFNICSTASVKPFSNGGAYSISKFAFLGFSKILREEMKNHGIRVCSMLPGPVKTDSWDSETVDPELLMPAEDIANLLFTIHNLHFGTVVEDVLLRPFMGDINF